MASIKFVLKSENNPAAIYVRLVDGRKTDIMAKTRNVINPAEWSKIKQQPKNLTDTDYKKLNSNLSSLKTELIKHYNKSSGIEEINTAWLKEFINPSEDAEGLPAGLSAYLQAYITSKKNKVSPNTLKKYNVVKHKLLRFEAANKTSVQIKDVNKSFQVQFEKYCIANQYSHNTIAMEIRFIKTICRHAKENGIDTHRQLEAIKSDYIKVVSIYLNNDELKKITEAEGLTDSLDNVRDWLLISCYSGQRISDFMRFEKSMIRYELNRKNQSVPLIEFVQKKTGKIMTLPLHKEILRILTKRGGEFPPAISDQKYNEYIKDVCEAAGLTEIVPGSKKAETEEDSGIYRKETGLYPKWELVTSHIGRRSFATNFYGIIPTSLLIAATGHSTEQMFLNYIGKSSSDTAKHLSEYF